MKKALCFTATLFLIFSMTTFAAPRNLEWGLSISEVESLEEEKDDSRFLEKEDGQLTYRLEKHDLEFRLIYGFQKENLYRATYVTRGDEMDRINGFMTMELLLLEYGSTEKEESEWHPGAARFQYDIDSFEDYQFAFLNEHLSYMTFRSTEASQIVNVISTEDGILHAVIHADKEKENLYEIFSGQPDLEF
ncbi:hypothetical protein [Halarsenatibacter silvermanii]|uniref:Uncharacterized protein n=1 Tax=Halarsenatibacter silvermanii TaxID=321763 RepID=A0A1G9RUK2_9FIRM|nr:hypothetical protein [Halarsenatibacter silvermanii]SDM26862.1 hypothetical protein SAMN04488692_12411 [Halarsenatibacter silvermanii]